MLGSRPGMLRVPSLTPFLSHWPWVQRGARRTGPSIDSDRTVPGAALPLWSPGLVQSGSEPPRPVQGI